MNVLVISEENAPTLFGQATLQGVFQDRARRRPLRVVLPSFEFPMPEQPTKPCDNCVERGSVVWFCSSCEGHGRVPLQAGDAVTLATECSGHDDCGECEGGYIYTGVEHYGIREGYACPSCGGSGVVEFAHGKFVNAEQTAVKRGLNGVLSLEDGTPLPVERSQICVGCDRCRPDWLVRVEGVEQT